MSEENKLDNENPTQEAKDATATVEKAVEETTPEKVEIDTVDENRIAAETPHDDFDWSIGNRHTLNYTQKELDDYLKDYEKSLNSISEFELVTGTVSSINDGNVLLDINYKSDGLVSLTEFRDTPDLKVGDTVEVYIEAKEDARGQLQLSRRKAKLIKAWDNIVDSYENGTIIKGTVVSKTKGGLIADVGGLETFLPGSQIDIKPIIDYDSYVGKTMEFKVVKINEVIKNAVVSHKALIESDLAEQRESIIGGLEKGQVLEGIVKNITDFGAFMDLGGVDGLLYITDISWGRINHPQEILELNQKLNVVVLDFDEDKKRISLGLKQLQPHPWEVLPADVGEGSTVKGKIVNIEDYGAFLEIIPGVEGLIHVSEVSWSNQPVNAREYFFLGQDFEAKVVTIDREERKMSLSIKQLLDDPWAKVIENYPVGSKHTGQVKNLTPYGVFVELKEGVGGMVHISDLSWTKRYSHPSEFTKVGSDIEIVILEVDEANRKLSLGHKQLEENPWDTFENVFPVGSYHEATLIKKEERGAIVQLPYGLEAFAPIKHIKKEDNSSAEVDESLTVKVIEFNRDDKRIIVSHLRYLEDIKREAEGEVRKEKDDRRKQTRTHIKKQNTKVEGTTLGDLNVFSELKDAFNEPKKAAPAKKEAPKKEAPAPKAEAPAAEEKPTEAPTKEEAPAKEEVKAEAPKAKAPSKKKADTDEVKDDLKKIEGIGPKISEKLNNAGIMTFAELAGTDVAKLKEILEAAGSRYRMHDPTTWPQQSALAAEGKYDDLKKLQDELDGGRK
ncbi:MAG: 30S ribosomal protein S1 [Saprospiraceae bacterium]|nr:30S ribosomal protein S1 [Bacteroidia bacterium]NNL93521.1 30S ribosomal protein S1 [Saprospiraceae bacterium]